MFQTQGTAVKTTVRSDAHPLLPVTIVFYAKNRSASDLAVAMDINTVQELLEQIVNLLNKLPVPQADGDGG